MLEFSAALTGTTQAPARHSLLGWVSSPHVFTLQDALSTVLVDSYDGAGSGVTAYGTRVFLNGEDVTADLAGDVSLRQEIDSADSAEFSLNGSKYNFSNTRDTWTRVPVQIFFSQGDPGFVQEVLRFDGLVWTGTHDGLNTVRVECRDRAQVALDETVCFEIDVLSGRTRGSIIRELALAAGFVNVTTPEGAVYSKPLTVDTPLDDFLGDFIEPEPGWHFRAVGEDLEIYEIRRDKPVADHRWLSTLGVEISSPVPPSEVASRWVARGTIPVSSITSEGITEEVTGPFSSFAIFNPQTTHRQDTSGAAIPRVFDVGRLYESFTEFQLVGQIQRIDRFQGGRLLQTEELEWGFVNPAAAKNKVRSDQTGPGPQGSDFTTAWIDINGETVAWSAAKFLLLLRRIETFEFDVEGNETGSSILQYDYHRREAPWLFLGSGSIINGVLVGSDGESYERLGDLTIQIEDFGLSANYELEAEYDESGPKVSEVQETSGFYSVRTHSTNATAYELFSGSFQTDLNTPFQIVEQRRVTSAVDESGLLLNETTSIAEYFAHESSLGPFDYGSFTSEFFEERFVTTSSESVAFNSNSGGGYVQVDYTDRRRSAKTFPGRPPVVAYRSSSWTTYQATPNEITRDDPAVETFFGRRVVVLNVEYVQSDGELIGVLSRRRARDYSLELTFARHETLVEVGDDLVVIDRDQRLVLRGIVIALITVRSRVMSKLSVTLESTLVEGVDLF